MARRYPLTDKQLAERISMHDQAVAVPALRRLVAKITNEGPFTLFGYTTLLNRALRHWTVDEHLQFIGLRRKVGEHVYEALLVLILAEAKLVRTDGEQCWIDRTELLIEMGRFDESTRCKQAGHAKDCGCHRRD